MRQKQGQKADAGRDFPKYRFTLVGVLLRHIPALSKFLNGEMDKEWMRSSSTELAGKNYKN
jgi:hypothetical protein